MFPDLSADYLMIDFPEPVTYYSKTGEGTYATAQTIEYAQVTQITKDDARSSPALLENDTCVFNLWRGPLGDIVPKIGDYLEDARRVKWVVTRVQPSDRDANGYQRYRLTTTAEN